MLGTDALTSEFLSVYHPRRDKFEQFREFLGISRFEFEFRGRGIFYIERFEFLVCSGFNHMRCDCTCACAVASLHLHNSISNVVVSLMIHDDMYISNFKI